jgi:hypothetical protein
MKNVDQAADVIGDSKFDALPARVQEALGELAGAAKEGLLALSVGVGLGVHGVDGRGGRRCRRSEGPSRH